MNVRANTIGLILLLILSGSCADKTSDKHTDEDQIMAAETTAAPTSEMQEIIDGYLRVKNDLIDSDSPSASQSAKVLLEALKRQGDSTMASLHEHVKVIRDSKDLEFQRQRFSNLSEEMYLLIKSSSRHEVTLYRQFCPMAFGNTGAYWLSEDEQVVNPYFGEQMLNCGTVTEILAAQ